MSPRKPFLLALIVAGAFVLLAACVVAPTPTPSECVDAAGGQLVNAPCIAPDGPGGAVPTPTRPPLPTADTGGSPGEQVFTRVAGCSACHTIDSVPAARGQVGPNLSHVGGELSAQEIRQSILDPNAVMASDCPFGPCSPGVMPQNFAAALTQEQIDDLVNFLSGLQ